MKSAGKGLRSIQISGGEGKKDGGQGDPCGAQRWVYRPAQWHPVGQEAVPQDQGAIRRHTLPAPGGNFNVAGLATVAGGVRDAVCPP